MPETRHYAPGSDSGGKHWAIVATLIQTAKLNDVEPLAS
jgi:transposase